MTASLFESMRYETDKRDKNVKIKITHIHLTKWK